MGSCYCTSATVRLGVKGQRDQAAKGKLRGRRKLFVFDPSAPLPLCPSAPPPPDPVVVMEICAVLTSRAWTDWPDGRSGRAGKARFRRSQTAQKNRSLKA